MKKFTLKNPATGLYLGLSDPNLKLVLTTKDDALFYDERDNLETKIKFASALLKTDLVIESN